MWLRMGDEASTRVVDDNANNLVIPDMRKTFFSGKSIDFDGTDDFINAGRMSFLNGLSALSVSTWINAEQVSTNKGIFSIFIDTNNQLYFKFTNHNKLFGAVESSGDNVIISSDSAVLTSSNVNQWHHIVFVYDGSQASNDNRIKFYFNGSLVASTITNTVASTTGDFSSTDVHIGKHRTEEWNGKKCDVAIWDTVLNANTVASIYNSGEPNNLTLSASYTAGSGVDKTANLQAYYRMGNASNDSHPTIQDQTSNDNDGTMTNMSAFDIVDHAPNRNSGDMINFDATADIETDTP